MNTVTITIKPARSIVGRRQYRITVRGGNGKVILTSGRQRLYNVSDAVDAVVNAFRDAPLIVKTVDPAGVVNTRKLRP